MGFVDNARTRLWGALDMRRDFEADRARFGVHASWKDFLRAREQTLCTTREYFLFHFYERSDAERDTFLNTQRRDDLIHAIGEDVYKRQIFATPSKRAAISVKPSSRASLAKVAYMSVHS